MAMKGYTAFLKTPVLECHPVIASCHSQDTCCWVLNPVGVFDIWKESGPTTAVLLGAASMICSNQNAASLCNYHVAFTPDVLLNSSTDTATTSKTLPFILSKRSDFYIAIDQSIASLGILLQYGILLLLFDSNSILIFLLLPLFFFKYA